MNEAFISKFIASFCDLQGLTVAEKKKSLFYLFNTSKELHTKQPLLDALTARLQPQTHLEHLFYIDFLIHFRRHQELAREALSNEIAAKKCAKQKWLFEKCGFLEEITAASDSLMLKFLKGLTPVLSEASADELFEFLQKKFGVFVAAKIVTSCSSGKIESVLRDNVNLSTRQLEEIYDKNPHLLDIYLEEQERFEGNKKFMDFNPLFKYVARKNIQGYMDLVRKYDFKLKLGKNTSRKILLAKRTEILGNPKLYIKNLHPKVVINVLGPDFPKIFFELFPRNVQDSPNSETSKLLKYYPKARQFELLQSTYNKIFAKKLEDSPHLLDEYVLMMIPDPALREKLAQSKENQEIKYYRFTTCFNIIKEKINFARDYFERGLYVATLVECCFLNQDYGALLEVAKYVNERFKNDNMGVLLKFLQRLTWKNVDLSKLNEEHWIEIKKILARPDIGSDYAVIELSYRYVDYLLRQDKPIKEMQNFFKNQTFELYQLQYIQNFGKFLPEYIQLVPLISTSIESTDTKLLAACWKHKSSGSKDQIDVFKYPRLSQSLQTVLDKNLTVEETTVSSALQLLICNRDGRSEELRTSFWKHLKFATPDIMKWFVKNRPDLIKKNLRGFLNFSLSKPEMVKDRRIWYSLKCYSHLKIAIIKLCKNNLTADQAKVLSFLLTDREFEKLAVGFDKYPLDLQMVLLRSGNWDTILKNCRNDNAALCLGPLIKVIGKIPRSEVITRLDQAKARYIPWLTKFATVQANLEECDLKQCFKYFLKNPSEQSWQRVTAKLDQKPSKVLATRKVPNKFKSRHFEALYPIFHSTNNKFLGTLLQSLHKQTLAELKPEFVATVLQNELFHHPEINTAVCSYLNADNAKVLVSTLQKYKSSELFSRKKINEFLQEMFKIYSGENPELVDTLLVSFQQVFCIPEIFDEYLLLNFMKLKNKNFEEFKAGIVGFYSYVVTRFGETVIDIFAEVLKKVLPVLCKNPYQLYHSLADNSIAQALLVIFLLPDSEPEDAESFQYYQNILEKLKALEALSVRLYLNLHFQQQKIEENVEYYERENSFCVKSSSWLWPGARKKIGYMYY